MAKKSTTTKSKQSQHKTSAKSAPKRTLAKPKSRTTVHKKKQPQPQSFKASKETQPFVSFSATKQTIYWAVFAMAILIFGLWLIKINVQVQELYNQIDENRIVQDELNMRLQEALDKKKAE